MRGEHWVKGRTAKGRDSIRAEGLSEGGPTNAELGLCGPRGGHMEGPTMPLCPHPHRQGALSPASAVAAFLFLLLFGRRRRGAARPVFGPEGEGAGRRLRGGKAPPRPAPTSPTTCGALTCIPGPRGSRRPGSRSPPGRRPRQRARTPGPARRPPAAAGSPPRCQRQGRSAPGRALPLPLYRCSIAGLVGPARSKVGGVRPAPGSAASTPRGSGRDFRNPTVSLPYRAPSLNTVLFCERERRASSPPPSFSHLPFKFSLSHQRARYS